MWLTVSEEEKSELLKLPLELRLERYMILHETDKCGECGTLIRSHVPKIFAEHAESEFARTGLDSVGEDLRPTTGAPEDIRALDPRPVDVRTIVKGLESVEIGDGDLIVVKTLPETSTEQAQAIHALIASHCNALGLRCSVLILPAGTEVSRLTPKHLDALGLRRKSTLYVPGQNGRR